MAVQNGPVAIRSRDGRRAPLGQFIDRLAKRTGRPVTEIARAAQISRAYYYVLRDSDQTPSIETLANLLTSLAVDFRLGDVDDEAEFVVRSEGDEWLIQLPYEGKRAARAAAVRNMTYASSLPNKPPPEDLPVAMQAPLLAGAAALAPPLVAPDAAGGGIPLAARSAAGEGVPPAAQSAGGEGVPLAGSSVAGGGGRTFVVGHDTERRGRSAHESRLLSELLSAAGDLDADRLEHLIVTARLLADKPD